jgi:hypothetical protein
MRTVELNVSPDLDKQLAPLIAESGKSVSQLAEEALWQMVEDREDYLDACAILDRNEPTIPSAQMRRELGLDD